MADRHAPSPASDTDLAHDDVRGATFDAVRAVMRVTQSPQAAGRSLAAARRYLTSIGAAAETLARHKNEEAEAVLVGRLATHLADAFRRLDASNGWEATTLRAEIEKSVQAAFRGQVDLNAQEQKGLVHRAFERVERGQSLEGERSLRDYVRVEEGPIEAGRALAGKVLHTRSLKQSPNTVAKWQSRFVGVDAPATAFGRYVSTPMTYPYVVAVAQYLLGRHAADVLASVETGPADDEPPVPFDAGQRDAASVVLMQLLRVSLAFDGGGSPHTCDAGEFAPDAHALAFLEHVVKAWRDFRRAHTEDSRRSLAACLAPDFVAILRQRPEQWRSDDGVREAVTMLLRKRTDWTREEVVAFGQAAITAMRAEIGSAEPYPALMAHGFERAGRALGQYVADHARSTYPKGEQIEEIQGEVAEFCRTLGSWSLEAQSMAGEKTRLFLYLAAIKEATADSVFDAVERAGPSQKGCDPEDTRARELVRRFGAARLLEVADVPATSARRILEHEHRRLVGVDLSCPPLDLVDRPTVGSNTRILRGNR